MPVRLCSRLSCVLAFAVLAACGGGSPSPHPNPNGRKDAGPSVDAGSTDGGETDGGAGCAQGLVECDGACIDARTDDANCGDCGHACATDQVCAEGVCVAACGNGVVDAKAGEDCDDGNADPGDGCSAACTAEPGFTCSGTPSHCRTTCGDGVIAGAEQCDDGDVDFNDGCNSDCEVEPGYACSGTPSVCAPVCGDGKLKGQEGCDDGNLRSGDGCDATCQPEPGWLCNGIPTVCESFCSDGLIVGDETCDDGNAANFDGCSSSCTVEDGYTCAGEPSKCVTGCGDGVIAGAEQCDDGNTFAGDGCNPICVVEDGFTCTGQPSTCITTCGDGIRAGTEACDDANATSGDGCSASCLIEPGYSCTGSPSMCVAGCGDGVVVGNELCDDGNGTSGDGCSSTCLVENGYACSGSPSACAAVCGDGNVIVSEEACDDGNTLSGDGCSAACTVEPGFTCTQTTPSSCAPICGDGLVKGSEGCDDSHPGGGDGCSALCEVEPGYSCTGEPSVCSSVCGDGVRTPGEQCDDGNGQAGDCCSPACTIESGCELEPNDTDATANAFSSVSVAGNVKAFLSPTATDKDVFGVSVPANARLIAETVDGPLGAQCAAKQIDTQIAVRDAMGGAVFDAAGTADDLGPGNWCSRFVSEPLAAGAYFVEVARSPQGGPVNDYALTVTVQPPVCGNGEVEAGESCDDGNVVSGDGCSSLCAWELLPEVEPNGTPATGSPVGSGGLASGAISSGGDVDVFQFTLTATSDVVIETFDAAGPPGCSVDTRIQLLGPDGTTVLGTDDDGGIGACSKLEPPLSSGVTHMAPGTYFVRVDGKGAPVSGYSLWIRKVATCGNGTIEGSEACDGQPNCTTTCDRVVVCGDGYVDGTESCDDGNTSSADGCSPGCTIEGPVEIEPNGTQAEADANAGALTISASTHVQGTLGSGTDEDTFKLSVATASVVRFETFGTVLGDCPLTLATRLTLYDAAFTPLYTDDDDGVLACSALTVNLAPGSYYVRVEKGAPAGGAVPYTLDVRWVPGAGSEVEPNDALLSANAIAGDDGFVTGGHPAGTDDDWYAVTVPAGKSIRAEVIEGSGAETCESNGIDSLLELYDAAGVLLDDVDDVGRGSCSLLDGTGARPAQEAAHKLDPGTYYLKVSSPKGVTPGAAQFDYRLVITIRQ
ncbi:MAG: DUF4215 domain-containing protein [Myxococcaceae bacterium]|nr:DUF4215 domain-containing protein [Myxococcaceae bacterium]